MRTPNKYGLEMKLERLLTTAWRKTIDIGEYMTKKPRNKWEFFDKQFLFWSWLVPASLFFFAVLIRG